MEELLVGLDEADEDCVELAGALLDDDEFLEEDVELLDDAESLEDVEPLDDAESLDGAGFELELEPPSPTRMGTPLVVSADLHEPRQDTHLWRFRGKASAGA